MSQQVLMGDTVQLTAEFVTFGGVHVDPMNITLKIMDSKGKQIGEIINIDSNLRQGAGIYSYDYIVPNEPSTVVYEFKGLIDGNPILGRDKLYITLVKED
jgi:hypothetical protein